jgi:branched-chain amino acid transport system substrate-binding protein
MTAATTPARGRGVAVACVTVVTLMLSACGTRMSSEAIDAADGSAPVTSVGVSAPLVGSGPGTGLQTGTGAAGATVATAPAPAAAGVPVAAKGPAAQSAPVPASGPTLKQAVAEVGPGVAGAACTQTLAPIILGHTSPASGIIGASTANMRAGIALWARAVNVAGGVQCHPVQVIQMDDAADPARTTSNLAAMKSKGVVAIVGAGLPTTFPAARRFAEANKIPFVGGDLIEPAWFSSPWMFPQGGSALAAYGGAIKAAAARAGTTKVGLIYCVEASICSTINEYFEAMATESGLDIVLRKVSSITSPDYTAECQALKSAGAEAVFVAMESSGNSRFARSCLSLGYAPQSSGAALAVSAQAVNDPNLRKLGMFLGTGTAPYQATDTVGTREFRAAYDRYSPGASIDQNSINSWTAGKLFEKALANVAAKARSGPVTTDLILEGLWMIKNEKLDGLAPGITFAKDAPPVQNDCYAVLALGPTGFTAPLGSKFSCFKALPRGF